MYLNVRIIFDVYQYERLSFPSVAMVLAQVLYKLS